MIGNYIKNIFFIAVIIIVQIWGLNDVRLFKLATPYIYPIILLFLPIGISKIKSIFIAFVTGFIIDSIVYTPGLNTASFTILGFLRPYLIKAFVDAETIVITKAPTISNIKWKSIFLIIEIISINTTLLFLFDSFYTYDIQYFFYSLLSSIFLSFIISFVFVYIYDLI